MPISSSINLENMGYSSRIKDGLEIDGSGTKWWYKDYKLHRDDGPAVIYSDGAKSWYKDGLLHREDGPARCWGLTYAWYKDGKLYEPTAHEIMTWKMNEKGKEEA